MTEQEITTAVKAGDRKAFDKLYELYWKRLVSYAALIAGEDYAKDTVHDVFVRIWINRKNLKETESLRPYLMRAVYNTSLNVLRKRANCDLFSNYTDSQIDFLLAGEFNPESSAIINRLYSQEVAFEIESALNLLPEKCRDIFRRSYIDGMSHKDIADSMGLSLSTVDNQIYKALKILREALKKSTFLLLLAAFVIK